MSELLQITDKPETFELEEATTPLVHDLARHPMSTEVLPDFSSRTDAVMRAMHPHITAAILPKLAAQQQPGFRPVASYEDSPYEPVQEAQPLAEQPVYIRRAMGGLAAGAFRGLLAKRSAED